MTEDFQQNSVFKYAKFNTLEELEALMPEKLKASEECLFIPPHATDDEINSEGEEQYRKQGARGGFVCLKWTK
jgi:hypothetical protein